MADTLVFVRHGQSQANASGLFCGLLDVSLTEYGRKEAVHAAELLNEAALWPPVCFCSPLLRARQTADAFNETLLMPPKRTIFDWRLAERNYGALSGRTKQGVRAEYGEEQFVVWRRSVHVAPPPMSDEQRRSLGDAPPELGLTESLHHVIVRVGHAWEQTIKPALHEEGSLLVIAHGNSLRAFCAILDSLTDTEVQALNIPNGHPLIYRLGADHKPVVRGGEYLEPGSALVAAEKIAREGGT
ncbi:2,3-bisphosphoglycerate-dependent phosphoglycerate mutase [Brooklawnia sp.]|uniref:2,3-bisphosphoglycerate-dependent phosphoglycerate mutase n=1 Tax=Brooklawnia sp. TaxID=2699740 RepID=UPI00311F09C7